MFSTWPSSKHSEFMLKYLKFLFSLFLIYFLVFLCQCHIENGHNIQCWYFNFYSWHEVWELGAQEFCPPKYNHLISADLLFNLVLMVLAGMMFYIVFIPRREGTLESNMERKWRQFHQRRLGFFRNPLTKWEDFPKSLLIFLLLWLSFKCTFKILKLW